MNQRSICEIEWLAAVSSGRPCARPTSGLGDLVGSRATLEPPRALGSDRQGSKRVALCRLHYFIGMLA